MKMIKPKYNFLSILKFKRPEIRKSSRIRKIIISTLACVTILSILVMSFLIYRKASNSIYDKVGSYSTGILAQSKLTLEGEMQNVERRISNVQSLASTQDALRTFMSLPDPSPAAADPSQPVVQTKKDALTAISTALTSEMKGALSGYYLEVASYDPTGTFVSSQTQARRVEERRTKVKESARENNNGNGIWYLEDQVNITYAKVFRNPDNNEGLICVIISWLPTGWTPMYKDVNVGEGAEVLILNAEGLIVSSRNKNIMAMSKYNDSFSQNMTNTIQQSEGKDMGHFRVMLDKKAYMGAYVNVSDTDWYLTAVIPGKSIDGDVKKVQVYLIWTIIACSIIVFFISILIARSISNPLKKLSAIMQKMKEGDLTVNAEDNGKDEVGDVIKNINDMVYGINVLVEGARQTAVNIVDASQNVKGLTDSAIGNTEQIAEVMQSLAAGASTQARDVSEFVQTIDTLAERIKAAGDSMQNVVALVGASKEVNTSAVAKMENLRMQSAATRTEVEKVAGDITDMSREIEKLGKIVDVILGVVDKTNLIALNSAIEAAKAKEDGKGFSVIAGEVKKLADEAIASLGVIGGIIEEVLGKTNAVVESADKAKDIIGTQIEAVEETSNIFGEVLSAMDQIALKAEEVNKKVLYVLKESQDTLNSIKGVSLISEETVAVSEEVSASTEEQKTGASGLYSMVERLNTLANDLDKAISVFKTV